MLILDNHHLLPPPSDSLANARAALLKSLDMADLWEACASLVDKVLPCHSCSLMFDIDGYEPQQGRHFIAQAQQQEPPPVTSLDVAAPFLDAHPRIRWYTFSQIVSQDARAAARLKAQNPTQSFCDFIHLAFWNDKRLEAVLSIRIRAERSTLYDHELSFLTELYPVLEASLQRVRTLESERVRHKAFEALLYRLPLATAIVDDRLSPLYVSSEARKFLSAWAGQPRQGKRLPYEIEIALRSKLSRVGPDDAVQEHAVLVPHPSKPEQRLRIDIAEPLQISRGRTHFILTFADAVGSLPQTTLDASAMPLLSMLSHSERKVAMLVASGLSNEQVACQLCRSRKTIESQISSIYRKLNIRNRTQLSMLLR